ncbi:hypothetical protein P280DRAFT_532677 [Massarina eburnea CBS 473.64]|uniref:Uncharacterized protein n=1 Tax=Massarina eburnea CBS 473.64 TaxID=1395130 RepID=A0A6A6RRP9_9PLEO|nr:hypothetical protein P280DRAFT_532677 [Massarina eburnea CBS 473.64]
MPKPNSSKRKRRGGSRRKTAYSVPGSEEPTSTWDIFRSRISGFELLPDESPPDDMLTYLHLRSPRAPTLPPTKQPPVTLTAETSFLLQTYLRTVATWMDLMDHSNTYEIMCSIASEHHKRHLLGQIMLVNYQSIDARSSGIDGANFWLHVRHEIGFALTTERPMVMDPMAWHVDWKEGDVREDVQGNHVLWILARVLNLIYGPESETATGRQKREGFLQELEDWRKRQLDSFIGIPYGEEDSDGFRRVFFTVTAAAAGTFWYHVTHILLYTEPSLQNAAYRPFIQDQAKRIGDIAISEFPDSLRVFASHGLYYAAKHISGIGRKARIWSIMNAVESELGYCTKPMVKRLQELAESGASSAFHAQ